MTTCTCPNHIPGHRHHPTCPRYMASSGPSGAPSKGNPRVRLPKPLATEATAAVDEGWPNEAAELLRAERERRTVVKGKRKDPKP